MQAEKLGLQDSQRDCEVEVGQLKDQLHEAHVQLQSKEEECIHLVCLAEQRRHEIAALQAEMKGTEGRTGIVLVAQGAQLSAASVALFRLTSRIDSLLGKLLSNHSLSASELEAVVFNNVAYNADDESDADSEAVQTSDVCAALADGANAVLSPKISPGVETPAAAVIGTLVGSTSLQVH